MADKYFPIKKGVACQLKWTWNTIRLQEGTSSCCHRVEPVKLTVENFENFHNHEVWISHRKLMLDGKFPQQGCQYCERIEKVGGTSDRMTHIQQPNLYPTELDTDPEAINVRPRILEVFLDNVCTLSCVYCDESNSSKVAAENRKFGYIKGIPYYFKDTPHDDFPALVEKFFEYLDKNYTNLKRLAILGGEPFYQKAFDRLITFIKNNNNPDLELNIVTSLAITPKRLHDFVAEIKELLVQRKIGRLDITVSIDCWGAEQEYVRHGLNMDKLRENFEYLVAQKWITLNVNSTLTSLTVKTMPELIEYINHHRQTRKIYHTFGHVDFKPWLHCDIFGSGFFDKDFEKIIQCMPTETEWDRIQQDYMKGLAKSLNQFEADPTKLGQLELFLDEIDRRRNLNWRSIFPWLDQYFLENKNVV